MTHPFYGDHRLEAERTAAAMTQSESETKYCGLTIAEIRDGWEEESRRVLSHFNGQYDIVHALLKEITRLRAGDGKLREALRMPTDQEIKLAAGEFTNAQELRSAKAVLAWRLRVIHAALSVRDAGEGS